MAPRKASSREKSVLVAVTATGQMPVWAWLEQTDHSARLLGGSACTAARGKPGNALVLVLVIRGPGLLFIFKERVKLLSAPVKA